MSGVCYHPKDAQVEPLQVEDYKSMVLTAERKCSMLKQQLEQMKNFCSQNSPQVQNSNRQTPESNAKPAQPAHILSFVEDVGETKSDQTLEPCQKNRASGYPANRTTLTRQNSQKITTDFSGAVYGTINNMMAGITESIRERPVEVSGNSKDQIQGVENVKINVKVIGKDQQSAWGETNSKILKRRGAGGGGGSNNKHLVKNKGSSSTHRLLKKSRKSALKVSDSNKFSGDVPSSQQLSRSQSRSQYQTTNFETIKSVTVRRKYNNGPSKKPSNQFHADSTVSKRKTPLAMLNKCINKNLRNVKSNQDRRNKDLVEIYHNIAVKDSHSSDSNDAKNKATKKENQNNILDMVPPLAIHPDNQNSNALQMSALLKNYEMPTIASRMKQVSKFYMNSYNFSKNFRSIPFCPSTSITPSHNIGINIQQVLRMVKTKLPTQNLPATLAYNIGLAAEKWDSKGDAGLSFLVSNMSSRVYSQCPLSKSVMNYQQLQEVAKTIPEETEDEGDEHEALKSPEMQSVIITGPSGDVKVTNRKSTVWTADPNNARCNCAPQKGIELNQVVNKIASATNQSQIGANRKRAASISVRVRRKPSGIPMAENKASMEKNAPLKGKEQKLKMVLNKLHDEFETMNKKYEELARKNFENEAANDGVSKDDTTEQLETLDKELGMKEEEIKMVMTLYQEVLALKEQVKNLKERSSKEGMSVKSQAFLSGYNRTTAAGVLNKLLRQVQHFSSHYKATN